MRRSLMAVLTMVVPLSVGACKKSNEPAPAPVQISATELYNAFEEDAESARRRFEGSLLVIRGELSSFFDGAPPGSHPAVTFKTDSGGSVTCGGDALIHLLPRVQKGRQVTLECPSSTARFWPQPNNSLELSDCEPHASAAAQERGPDNQASS
jgi:hypothetical protein